MNKKITVSYSIKKYMPVILGAVSFLMFLPVIMSGRTFMGHDMINLGVPISAFIRNSLLSGEINLWNPYINCGHPTVATSMGTCFYPLNLLFIIINPLDNMLVFFIIHQVLAVLSAWYYMKYKKFDLLPAAVGSLLFAFSAARLYYSTNIEFMRS